MTSPDFISTQEVMMVLRAVIAQVGPIHLTETEILEAPEMGIVTSGDGRACTLSTIK